MSAKRALVVDDSKSARVFLSGLLEKYSIEVDSVESAEQAIDYLTHHRPPDVIFMDHLMPGMDGFQALAAIKEDPRTATIPVLMYTSQEGELYLGQARALGAVGVLPKQIHPADMAKVLYQLHLFPERRRSDPDQSVSLNPLTDATLRERLDELRRELIDELNGRASRTEERLQVSLEQALSRQPSSVPLSGRPVRWGWIVAAIAVIVAVESLFIAHRDAAERVALAREVGRLHVALATSSGRDGPGHGTRTAAQSAAPGAARPAVPRPIVELVPFGQSPLGGSRLDELRRLFDRLTAQGFHGTVRIEVFPGRFCLVGSPSSGYSLAPDTLAYSDCSLVGTDPAATALSPQTYPVAFADLAASFRASSQNAVDVRVDEENPKSTIVSYPPVTDSLTAGDWNRAASANNRIEIRVR